MAQDAERKIGKLQRMSSVASNTESDDELYREIFFIDNGLQSNIYCNTIIRYPSKTQERLLVGTLRGKVACLERHEDVYAKEKFHSSHSMQARDVYFSYIPSDAEIISIDAFYQHSSYDHGYNLLIVGVTIIIKKRDGNDLHFLNIYNSIEPSTEFDIDKLAQVLCQHLQLNFIPYQLTHADIYIDGKPEVVFLLSGSDQQIHVFRCDEKQTFEEYSCGKFFPEFATIPGLVIWMVVRNCAENKRFSAIGCDNGELVVSITDNETLKIKQSWSLSMDGPVSSVRFYSFYRKNSVNNSSHPRELCQSENLNLLVTSCLEVSVVFTDIEEKGLENMAILNQSDQFDSVTCSCVADIDFDGKNEIILGTYGQELMIYKWTSSENDLSDRVRFDLIWTRSFSKPILSIHGLDLMNDGMQELVIVSLTGVHILQQNVNRVAENLLEKIIKAFPDKLSVANHIDVLNMSGRVKFIYGSSEDEIEVEDGGSDELQGVISAICSSNNSYNEIT